MRPDHLMQNMFNREIQLEWKTVTVDNRLYSEYLLASETAVQKLSEEGVYIKWSEQVNFHLWLTRMVPVHWGETWVQRLVGEKKDAKLDATEGTKAFRNAINVARQLSRSELGDCSLERALRDEIEILEDQKKTFKLILTHQGYRDDWTRFLQLLPGKETMTEIELSTKYLIKSNELYKHFEPLDCLIHVGAVWPKLSAQLSQAITAPRWNTFLQVYMKGSRIHREFPEYPVPKIPELYKDSGLLASWANEDRVLLEYKTTEIRKEPAEKLRNAPPLPHNNLLSLDSPTISGSMGDNVQNANESEDLAYEESDEPPPEKWHHQYSGKAYRIVTESNHVKFQPEYEGGQRRSLQIFDLESKSILKVSIIRPGMLLVLKREPKNKRNLYFAQS